MCICYVYIGEITGDPPLEVFKFLGVNVRNLTKNKRYTTTSNSSSNSSDD